MSMRLARVFCVYLLAASVWADEATRRESTLGQLKRVLQESPAWTQWLEQSGELPPDFDAMPSIPNLPNPLLAHENTPEEYVINTVTEWQVHRETLLNDISHWIFGTVPPRPDNLLSTNLSEMRGEGCTVREVELQFGVDHSAKLWMELIIPDGNGPFPVFLTQHNHRAWGLIAARRGYIACVYAGSDSRDDTDSFLASYPDYDWSRLTRRAWAGSRCIDYLESETRADTTKIVITGHSRNGKQSLIASALDERIAAVISSSSGAGGTMPARLVTEQSIGEGIEFITRNFPEWFHPRWRFFVGREQKLPMDLHTLVALSAPRPCLLSMALNDGVEDAWAMERVYWSVQPVYELLGAPQNLRILRRSGGHETWPTVIDRFLDWSDAQFGRGSMPAEEEFLYPHDWNAWKAGVPQVPDPETYPSRDAFALLQTADGHPVDSANSWEEETARIRSAVQEMLGTPPPGIRNSLGTYGTDPAGVRAMLNRDKPGDDVECVSVSFGEYITGDMYLPKGAFKEDAKLPAILWFPPYNPPRGYTGSYVKGDPVYRNFARQGYVVFCFDPVGTGRRVEELKGFYSHYPQWSIMGKMIRDAQCAMDALLEQPYIDAKRVTVLGYGTGALQALHFAALDNRASAYALVCIPQPFVRDDPKVTGGTRRWSHDRMWLPRLGTFFGKEDRLPYDIPVILAMAAPRPVLVVAPTLDRDTVPTDISEAVEAARTVFRLLGYEDRLELQSPEYYNSFDPAMQALVTDWLNRSVH
ncbi:MAG: hypothetical protein AMXMBFR84_36380 [Candidatus Hydrogenedentota bacterium]